MLWFSVFYALVLILVCHENKVLVTLGCFRKKPAVAWTVLLIPTDKNQNSP